VRFTLLAAIVGIVVSWEIGPWWMTLSGILVLFGLLVVRGAVRRWQHERWMDDLARATYRLMLAPPIRLTTSWDELGEAPPPPDLAGQA
jgi:hypothetical protein